MKRLCLVAVILFALVILRVTGTFAQEHGRASIAESFKRYAQQFIATKKVAVFYEEEKENSGNFGWHKAIGVPRADYKLDLRSTDSHLAPYIGTIEYYQVNCTTLYWNTKADAQKDTVCAGDPVIEQNRDTYAFRDGKWVLKTTLFRFHSDEEWMRVDR